MARVDALLFELKRGWPAYLAVVVLAGVFVALTWYHMLPSTRHGPMETATIVRIGDAISKYDAGSAVVVASDSDGLIGQARVPASQVRGCKVGDGIEAERIGAYLKLKPKPCK